MGIVAIILITAAAGVAGALAVSRVIVGYLERRHSTSVEPSITQRELSEMIASAVEKSLAPLHDDIEDLRGQLAARDGAHRLPEQTASETQHFEHS